MKRSIYDKSAFVIGLGLLLTGWPEIYPQNSNAGLFRDITHELVTRGFESVDTRVTADRTLFITYENRIYRNQFYALGVVLGLVEKFEFDEIEKILICPQIQGFEFCQIIVPVTALHELVTRQISAVEFVKKIDYFRHHRRYFDKGGGPVQDIYRKIDIIFKPGVAGRFGNFEDAFKWEFSLVPMLQSHPWRGGMANFEIVVPLYDEIGTYTKEVRPRRAWLSQTVRLPFDGKSTLAVGLYTPERWGYALSTDWYLLERYLNVGVDWEYTGFAVYQNKTWSYSQPGRSTHRFWLQTFLPKYNIDVTLHQSQYLYGDHGWGVEINRMFGETTIGFSGVITNVDEIGIISLRIPIFPVKRMRPGRFRIYHEFYHGWIYQSTSESTTIGQPFLSGRRPGLGYDRKIKERELLPAYIKNNPDILNRALFHAYRLKGAKK